MNNDQEVQELGRILQVGIKVLSDPDIKVGSNLIDDLSSFKNFIRNILNGKLVVVVKEHYDEILSKSNAEETQKPENDVGDN